MPGIKASKKRIKGESLEVWRRRYAILEEAVTILQDTVNERDDLIATKTGDRLRLVHEFEMLSRSGEAMSLCLHRLLPDYPQVSAKSTADIVREVEALYLTKKG